MRDTSTVIKLIPLLSLEDALHLLQRFFNSSNQIKQIHTILFTSNALVASRWKTKCVYNTLIRSYLITGQYKTSLALFTHMLASQVRPINLTFPSLIKAACSSFSVSYGVALHGQTLKRGVLWDPFVQTSFVRFYGEVCDLKSSRKMFDGIVGPCVVACNSLLDACGRNGEMDFAFELFQRMPVSDVVSWTTVINGFSKNGLHAKAVMLFGEMMIQNECEVITPNEATFVSVLSSCANLDRGGLHLGKQIHGYVTTREIILTTTLGTALLDMYGKAGDLEMALTIFRQIRDKKVCAWNAIISALASNGRPKKALHMFEMMKSMNVHPNGITLLAVLTACARSRLVDLGIQLFSSICGEYKIIPTSEHYGCIVDLIGRAGLLVDAANFIKNLPFEPDASVLGALLGACKIHENAELGKKVGKQLIGLQPKHCGQYVALSTLNALDSNWSEAEQMRKAMTGTGIRKIPAYSVLS
ncbi:PREDICTED: putative pentatricopeptide repeat-containing protein At1g10330 isoform X1 [Camelina sativa]|uniref:Pentatricopeptide repeat-containing protein At1g10330 isoform X1 n=1 Tax=Camelina sativa TaxID=90675 RepID=A0ABM0VMC4_CAMSA|nr:PREDICTED: putative pentatricopeptide repeat-containing protein At1g10330 isoform X1 [Camelina sativa]